MILPPADWTRRESLRRLMTALGGADGLVRYVGGAVRDTLLGLPVADIDGATSQPPEEVVRRIREAGFRAVPTGIGHGTVTAVLPDGSVEVTTLRRDVATDGRHAEVAFTGDWREDAARRDFTINALSADPESGAIHDYFDGLADLTTGRVRFIGEPLSRIAEDHLRILRFFRFHARFGKGAPDAAGLDACTARANDLMTLSRERIAQEMLKLLAVASPEDTVAQMQERGLFAPIVPEIAPAGVAHLRRLCRRERAAGTADPLRRLAALLPPDPVVADAVAARLKLSNAQRKRLICAADAAVETNPRALAHAVGTASAIDRILLWSDDEAGAVASARAIADWRPPHLPIKGGDLVARGLTAGPLVARTLRAIERAWIAEGFPDAERVARIADAAVAQTLASSR